MNATLLGFLVVLGILAAIVGITGLINLFTFHDRTIQIESTFIDPAGDSGSHYVVYGKDDQIIELERLWWDFGTNIDKLLAKTDANINKTITYSCWGIVLEQIYWYSNCYKIKEIQ